MIVRELKNNMYHTYSDAGFYIHGGMPEGNYADAWDPAEREYTETDIPIETDEEPTIEEKAEAYDIITGVQDENN